MPFGALLSSLFAKLVAMVSTLFMGLGAASGGGVSAGTHVTTPVSHADASGQVAGPNGQHGSHDSSNAEHAQGANGSAASDGEHSSSSGVAGMAGISAALAGLGTGVSSCVMNVLNSPGGVSSANVSQLAPKVAGCVTSGLNSAQLPAGTGTCVSAIMSSVDSAIAGKVPSFDISACIPSGLPTNLPTLGTGESIPGLSNLSSALSGLGTGVVSCVLNALTSAGSITSANSSALATTVTGCVTSALGSATLPGGSSNCVSSIMSSIRMAQSGQDPSFEIASCIPSGLLGQQGTGTDGGGDQVGGPSGFSGLANLFSGGFPGLGAFGSFGFSSHSDH